MGQGLLLTLAVLDRNAVTPETTLIFLPFRLPTIVSKKKEKKRKTNYAKASISKPVALSAPIYNRCLFHAWAFYLFNRKKYSLECWLAGRHVKCTVKSNGVRAVNTSVDSTISKTAHTVIVLCVNVNRKCLAIAFFKSPYLKCTLNISIEAAVLCHQTMFCGAKKVSSNLKSSNNLSVNFLALESFS